MKLKISVCKTKDPSSTPPDFGCAKAVQWSFLLFATVLTVVGNSNQVKITPVSVIADYASFMH